MSYMFTASNGGVHTQADASVGSGAATQLVTSTPTVLAKQKVVVQSIAGNSNKVRVGDSSVSSTRGIELSAGDSVAFDGVQDPSKLWAIAIGGTQSVVVAWW